MCVNTLTGDQSLLETAANVIISLPFIFLGMQTPRKNLNMKVYANSLIGVGIASSLYHSSRERLRKYLRWADYTMIASATVVIYMTVNYYIVQCLSRALREENPKFLMAASALALPFQPLLDPDLKTAHNVHARSGTMWAGPDNVHKMSRLLVGWHLAAAIGVGTCNKLLQ
ncbi:unnamed protein product [Brassica oleracea var. botrytis]